MKVYNKIVVDIETGKTLEEDSYEYDGAVAKCEGGSPGKSGPPGLTHAQLEMQNMFWTVVKHAAQVEKPQDSWGRLMIGLDQGIENMESLPEKIQPYATAIAEDLFARNDATWGLIEELQGIGQGYYDTAAQFDLNSQEGIAKLEQEYDSWTGYRNMATEDYANIKSAMPTVGFGDFSMQHVPLNAADMYNTQMATAAEGVSNTIGAQQDIYGAVADKQFDALASNQDIVANQVPTLMGQGADYVKGAADAALMPETMKANMAPTLAEMHENRFSKAQPFYDYIQNIDLARQGSVVNKDAETGMGWNAILFSGEF